MKPQLSVIIPFLNESENIEKLVQSLNDFFFNRSFNAEVIFVNDGSKDDSVEKLRNHVHMGYQAKIINLSKNYGSHAALRAGIKNASGMFFTFTYADQQDPLSLISVLYDEINEGNDIVWAHRRSVKMPMLERFFSQFYAFLMRKFVISDYPLLGSDVVMFNGKVAAQLNENIEKNSSLFLQILVMGFKQTSVTYDKNERKAGKSKWTLSKKIKMLLDSFVAFSYAPIRFVTIIGVSFFIIGSFWFLYIIWRKLFIGDLNTGWPALISILLIGFGVTNISLGIIAEYLWRTLDASRKRPAFIIDEVIEITP